MARTSSVDPLTRYAFTVYVELPDGIWAKSSFESVTSPRLDFSINRYVEGGRHLNPHAITDGATFSPITMQRGKTYTADFYRWVEQVFRAFYSDKLGTSSNYRATIWIDHYNRSGKVIKKYRLENARPAAYIPSSNFGSMDDSAVSIETLMVEYEGYAEYSVQYSQMGAILGSQAGNLLNRALGNTPDSLPAGPIAT